MFINIDCHIPDTWFFSVQVAIYLEAHNRSNAKNQCLLNAQPWMDNLYHASLATKGSMNIIEMKEKKCKSWNMQENVLKCCLFLVMAWSLQLWVHLWAVVTCTRLINITATSTHLSQLVRKRRKTEMEVERERTKSKQPPPPGKNKEKGPWKKWEDRVEMDILRTHGLQAWNCQNDVFCF